MDNVLVLKDFPFVMKALFGSSLLELEPKTIALFPSSPGVAKDSVSR
jgi:hypothetical protein